MFVVTEPSNLIKYRAFYKYDLTAGEVLPFYVKEVDFDLMFVMEEPVPIEEAIMYPFSVPFADPDWVVHRWTGFVDSEGVNIWESDLVRFQYNPYFLVNGSEKEYEGVIMWDDTHKTLGVKSFSRETDRIIPLGNFVTNGGKLRVKTLGLYQ